MHSHHFTMFWNLLNFQHYQFWGSTHRANIFCTFLWVVLRISTASKVCILLSISRDHFYHLHLNKSFHIRLFSGNGNVFKRISEVNSFHYVFYFVNFLRICVRRRESSTDWSGAFVKLKESSRSFRVLNGVTIRAI